MKKVLFTGLLTVLICGGMWGLKVEAFGGYTLDAKFPLVISEAKTKLLKVVYNGMLIIMKSYDSYRELNLSRGINTITVCEMDDSGTNYFKQADSVQVYADVQPVPLKIIHTWDSGDNYVDIYVREPTGEECYWSHKSTQLGGVLDIGSDTVGYGPQIYTMPFPNPGVYEIYVSYYSGSSSMLTEITTYVIINEGTDKEERKVFQATLTSAGEKVLIGKVEIK